MENQAKEKIYKLKKLNAYESLWTDCNLIVNQIMAQDLNVLSFRNNLKALVYKLIKEVADYEFFFLKMLTFLEPPEKQISHSLNTAIFAYILSTHLDIDHKMIPKIVQAALLHDVGKLNFNEQIKQLYIYRDDEPDQVNSNHSVWGERVLLYYLKTDPEIARLVLNHHEQSDGGGYPRALKAADLTMADQILITANLLDNIIQKSNYPGFEMIAHNIETILSGYSQKFIPQMQNLLHEIFSLKSESRKFKRYKMAARGKIENENIKVNTTCEIYNISSVGVEISTPIILNTGMTYKINAKISSNLLLKNKICKIVWNKLSEGKFIYGLQFETPHDVNISQLINLL